MSQQQSPKQSVMSMLLWAAIIFVGFQLWQSTQRQQGPAKTEAQLLTELREQNKALKTQEAQTAFMAYEKAVNADTKLTQPEKDRKWLEAQVLLIDTNCKAAVKAQDFGKIGTSADTMTTLQRRFVKDPIWNEQFTVAKSDAFPNEKVSLAELKDRVREVSSDLGKKSPVWGFFPGYQVIDFLVGMTGRIPGFSYALACLILAILVRAAVFPLSHRTMMHGRKMAQLAPLLNEVRQKHATKDGKPQSMEQMQAMQADQNKVYQEYGLNPFQGCAPAFLQMPLFLIIYQSMLHYRFEFEKGLFLWINPALGKATDGFLGANLGQKDYILLTLYGISMVVTQLLTPISDPNNAKQQRMMGLSITVFFSIVMFFWPVPSAFVLYWVFTNILATVQSLWTYRLPMEPLQKKNSPTGGVHPLLGGSTNGQISSPPNKTGTPKRHKPKKK